MIHINEFSSPSFFTLLCFPGLPLLFLPTLFQNVCLQCMHVMLCPASSIFFPSLRPYVCTTGSFLSQNLITLLLLVHLGFLSEPTGTYSLLHNSLLFLHNKAVLQARCCICCLFYSDYFLDLLFNPEDEGDLFVLNIS